MLYLILQQIQKTTEVCLDQEYFWRCRKRQHWLFHRGHESHPNSTGRDMICMSIAKKHFAALSVIYHSQSSETAPTESKSGTTKGVLWAQFLIWCTTFFLTCEKSRGTSYKQTWDLSFLSLCCTYMHKYTRVCVCLHVFLKIKVPQNNTYLTTCNTSWYFLFYFFLIDFEEEGRGKER